MYVDNSIDEPSILKNNQVNDFNIHNLTNINSITLQTQSVNDIQIIFKADVDHFHDDNEKNSRDLGLSFYDGEVDLVKYNQDNDFSDIKLTDIDFITINRNPNLDKEISKKNVDDSIGDGTILIFNQTIEII